MDLTIQEMEVEWYRVCGKYPELRIKKDTSGNAYVIGDWSWSRGKYPPEVIEPRMAVHCGIEPLTRKPRTCKQSERNIDIVQMRKQGIGLQEIADKYHISKQRVDQIVRRTKV